MTQSNLSFSRIFNPQAVMFAFCTLSGVEGLAFAAFLVSLIQRYGNGITRTQIGGITFVALLGAGFLVLGVLFYTRRGWPRAFADWLRRPRITAWVFVILALLLAVNLSAFIFLPGAGHVLHQYWISLAAIFLYLMFVSTQALVAHGLIVYNKRVEAFILRPFPQQTPKGQIVLNKWQKMSFVLISAFYLLIALYLLIKSPAPVNAGDTVDYLYMAGIPLSKWSLFFTNVRPWTVPLFYKLLPQLPGLVPHFQTILWAASWGLLAFLLARSLKPAWFQPIAYTITLLFSMTSPILLWNRVILSESISISLFALFVALWFILLKRWDFRVLMAIIILAFLWQNTREAMIYLLLMLTMILALVGIIRSNLRAFLVISIFFGVFIFYGMTNTERAYRYRFPLINILGKRILTEQRYLDYFVESGMPANETLLNLAGGYANSQDFAFFNDRRLRNFRLWLDESGRTTYLKFMLVHPEYAIQGPVRASSALLLGDYLAYREEGSPAWPEVLDTVFYPNQGLWIFTALGLTCFLAWTVTRPWKRTDLFWIPAVLLLLTLPYGWIVWIGDEMEISRHAILFSILVRLVSWMVILFFLSYLISTRTRSERVNAG